MLSLLNVSTVARTCRSCESWCKTETLEGPVRLASLHTCTDSTRRASVCTQQGQTTAAARDRAWGARLPARVGPWYRQTQGNLTLEPVLCMQNKVQLDAALAYLSQRGAAPLDPAALDEAAGVGVVVRAACLRASPCRASGARRCMHAACALKTITAAQWESSLVYQGKKWCITRWARKQQCSMVIASLTSRARVMRSCISFSHVSASRLQPDRALV